MARWEANSKERLEAVALDLFEKPGYCETTVADIAERAGVTSRTYFRYFPDKREVLFGGAERMNERIGTALRDAPTEAAPMTVALSALMACGDLFTVQRRDDLRRRDALIRKYDELKEREAAKLASIADAIAAALIERGRGDDEAHLIGDLAAATFRHASRLWTEDQSRPYEDLVARAHEHIRHVFDPAP